MGAPSISELLLRRHDIHLFVREKMGKLLTLEQRFTRIKPGTKVTMEFPNDKYENCQIRNLSLTKMFVNGVFSVKKGEYCFAYLCKREKRVTSCLQTTARVVRRNASGIGLEFTSMSAETYMFLQELLYGGIMFRDLMQQLPDNCPFEIQDPRPIAPKSKRASLVLLDNKY